MRRVLSFLFLLCLLTGLAAAQAAGPAGTLSVRFYDESAGCYGALTDTDRVNLTLDGAALYPLDVPALVQYPAGQNGRTLVPVRLIAESLGASVTWVPDTRQVILQKGRAPSSSPWAPPSPWSTARRSFCPTASPPGW